MILRHKLALIMNEHSYAGREYLSRLKDFDIDVICIGSFPKISTIEEERCNGLWKPPAQSDLELLFDFYYFNSLESSDLKLHLSKKNYFLGIQGGTGIIDEGLINFFKLGIINFHPGDLPNYRGCSAPEWQLLNRKEIICTVHKLTKNIDAGPIIFKKRLNVNLDSYQKFRSSIYPEISILVREILCKALLDEQFIRNAKPQDETKAKYWRYHGEKNLRNINQIFETKQS